MDSEDVYLSQEKSNPLWLYHHQAAREQLTGVSFEQNRKTSISIQVPAAAHSELRDEAQLSGFSEVLKDQTYQETQGALELESFFEDNDEVYQVLAKDYI